MKSVVVSILLSVGLLSSSTSWSVASQIELGAIDVYPGQEVEVDLSTLPIYEGISYQIDCKLEALKEDSHMKIKATAKSVELWVSNCTGSAHANVLCPLTKDKETLFGFKNISKTDGLISLRNLDFNQVFSVSCTAAIVK